MASLDKLNSDLDTPFESNKSDVNISEMAEANIKYVERLL